MRLSPIRPLNLRHSKAIQYSRPHKMTIIRQRHYTISFRHRRNIKIIRNNQNRRTTTVPTKIKQTSNRTNSTAYATSRFNRPSALPNNPNVPTFSANSQRLNHILQRNARILRPRLPLYNPISRRRTPIEQRNGTYYSHTTISQRQLQSTTTTLKRYPRQARHQNLIAYNNSHQSRHDSANRTRSITTVRATDNQLINLSPIISRLKRLSNSIRRSNPSHRPNSNMISK